MIITSVHWKEMERIKNCQGCRHLSLVWQNGCCMYYLNTGNRRPNPAGVPDCKVRDIVCSQKEIDDVNQKLEKKIEQLKSNKDKAERLEKDRGPKWDVEKAKKLYDEGKTFQQIADEVGANKRNLMNYAYRKKWGYRYGKVHEKLC